MSPQVPSYYTWASNKTWARRKQGVPVEGWQGIRLNDAIGRVYAVHPNQQECFFLRLLLHEIRGPRCFADLRTYDQDVCQTYREACKKHGLLADDDTWDKTLEEATASRSPLQIRQLFAIMMTMCNLADPLNLWEKYKDSMAEDFLRNAQRQHFEEGITFSEPIYNAALLDLDDHVRRMGCDGICSYGLPEPEVQDGPLTSEYLREINYDEQEMASIVCENERNMVREQREVYERVITSITENQGGLFFLDAPGGTGKTFLINTLLAKIRQNHAIALAVAPSGIAATLLEGGRTAHSMFKLPLDLAQNEEPTCNISRRSNKAKIMQDCKLIIWDEATMSHKRAFEALDRLLRDLRRNNHLMGGVTVLLSGDFRQTLPIIPKGTRADEVNACLKSSPLWTKVRLSIFHFLLS